MAPWWRTGDDNTVKWLRVANPLSFVITAIVNGIGSAGVIGIGVGQV